MVENTAKEDPKLFDETLIKWILDALDTSILGKKIPLKKLLLLTLARWGNQDGMGLHA